MRLAADLSGVDDVDALMSLARTAERRSFDVVLLGCDAFTVLATLAAVTDRIGLVGTVDPNTAAPFAVARQIATLPHLSDGRAGWVLAGEDDARAAEFVTVVRAFWDSWQPGAVRADPVSGVYTDVDRFERVDHHGPRYDARGLATLPAGPRGHPTLLQDGDFERERLSP